MSRSTPRIREFAERLIAHDAKANASSRNGVVGFPVLETLRPHLSTLMGNAGFRALLSRALSLARLEVPWLRALQVRPEGSVEGLEQLRVQLGPEEIAEGEAVLLTQMLGLLVAFIGEGLAESLVQEVWPKLPGIKADAGSGH